VLKKNVIDSSREGKPTCLAAQCKFFHLMMHKKHTTWY